MKWCSFRKKGVPRLFLLKKCACLSVFFVLLHAYINMDKYD